MYITKRKGKEIPKALLLLADTVGFGGFLAILIANGVVSNKHGGFIGIARVLLMAYNSFPWVVCA